eukprot:TRINITY_DN3422_c1_g1_i14.p1 TRINITY_DN3422_c1_g1~~TRINITY_DN3422_c1_g1_i14.p1  ORF type:complete len:1390 (-),score=492.63 TRINITY_DN3422_c1_g1_i14:3656-7825(-)
MDKEVDGLAIGTLEGLYFLRDLQNPENELLLQAKKHVLQVQVFPTESLIVTRTDTFIRYLVMPSDWRSTSKADMFKGDKLKKTKGCSLFVTHQSKGSVSMCTIVKNKLQLYKWDGKKMEEQFDITLSSPPLQICFASANRLCFSVDAEYEFSLLDLESGDIVELFANPSPSSNRSLHMPLFCLSNPQDNQMFLFYGNCLVCVELSQLQEEFYLKFNNSEPPVLVSFAHPYVLAAFQDGTMEVASTSGSVVDTLQDIKIKDLFSLDQTVFALYPDQQSMSRLMPLSKMDQLETFLKSKQFDEALDLLREMTVLSSSERKRMAQEVRQSYGYSLFTDGNYSRAFAQMAHCGIHLMEIVASFEGFIQVPENYETKIPMVSGEALKIAMVAFVSHFLSDKLHPATSKSKKTPFVVLPEKSTAISVTNEDVDNILLTLYLETNISMDSLLGFMQSDQSVRKDTFVEQLTKYGRWDALVELFMQNDELEKALQTMETVGRGKQDRYCIDTTAAYLAQCQDEELIRRYSTWVLVEDPVAALRIFVPSRTEDRFLDPRMVVKHLKLTSEDAVLPYLEDLVIEQRYIGEVFFHNELVVAYLRAWEEATDDSQRADIGGRLSQFLSWSEKYEPTKFISLIPEGLPVVRQAMVELIHSKDTLTEFHSVYAWGDNSLGQLGCGWSDGKRYPELVEVMSGKSVRAIASGDNHTVLCTGKGYVYTWGDNTQFQLGVQSKEQEHIPKLVESMAGYRIASVAACGNLCAALTEDGGVFWWGFAAESFGFFEPKPVMVKSLAGKVIKQIAVGSRHIMALSDDGQVFSWLCNNRGQLGHESLEPSEEPKLVHGLEGTEIVFISCGEFHSAAVSSEGELFVWGDNSNGQLGQDIMAVKMMQQPVRLQLPNADERVGYVSCGGFHTVIKVFPNIVYVMGSGNLGQLGLLEPLDADEYDMMREMKHTILFQQQIRTELTNDCANAMAKAKTDAEPESESSSGGNIGTDEQQSEAADGEDESERDPAVGAFGIQELPEIYQQAEQFLSVQLSDEVTRLEVDAASVEGLRGDDRLATNGGIFAGPNSTGVVDSHGRLLMFGNSHCCGFGYPETARSGELELTPSRYTKVASELKRSTAPVQLYPRVVRHRKNKRPLIPIYVSIGRSHSVAVARDVQEDAYVVVKRALRVFLCMKRLRSKQKEARARDVYIGQLVEAEKEYVDLLSQLNNVYLKATATKNYVSEKMLSLATVKVERMILLHMNLMEAMQATLNDRVHKTMVGELWTSRAEAFKVYVEYVRNHGMVLEALMVAASQHQEFRTFVEEQERKNPPFKTLLEIPVGRVEIYAKHIVPQLLKMTSAKDLDHMPLQRSQLFLSNFVWRNKRGRTRRSRRFWKFQWVEWKSTPSTLCPSC